MNKCASHPCLIETHEDTNKNLNEDEVFNFQTGGTNRYLCCYHCKDILIRPSKDFNKNEIIAVAEDKVKLMQGSYLTVKEGGSMEP